MWLKLKDMNFSIIFFGIIIVLLVLALLLDVKKYFSFTSVDIKIKDINAAIIDYKDKNGVYPEMKSWVEIFANWNIIGYQWKVDKQLRESLKLTSSYDKNYIYTVNFTNDRYQLSYVTSKIIVSEWDNMWLILQNEEPVVSNTKGIDVETTSEQYTARISDDRTVKWNWTQLKVLKWTFLYEQSCKDYLVKNPNLKWVDSPQTIHPLHYNWDSFDVYCDMSTDWWGWTVTTMIADSKTKNIFNTNNTDKILDIKNNISSKWQINEIWTDNKDKDIMIKCFTANVLFREYEKPLIIFSFTKKDLINLVKEQIAGTQFSSKKLNATYDGKRYLLQDQFGWSSAPATMRIQSINNENMFYYNKWQVLKCRTQLGKNSICHDNDSLQFNSQNYCITAIR